MGGKELIELTNKVYKQTLLFPKKEPLRYKIRETADDILRDVVEWEASSKKDLLFEIEKDLQIIKAYFNVAKWQNWVSYFDILKIEMEYDKIGDFYRNQKVEERLVRQISAPTPKIPSRKKTAKGLTAREKKILDIIKEKEKVQVGEVKEILKDVSKRTLRRDFDDLLKQHLVERVGHSNDTYYVLSKE
jgi:DNA-binding transcriptional ArsR family regulator